MKIQVSQEINVPMVPYCRDCYRKQSDKNGALVCELFSRFLSQLPSGEILKCRECHIALYNYLEKETKKMNEILFRGKALGNGEWVYGNLAIDTYDKAGVIEKNYMIVDSKYDIDEQGVVCGESGLATPVDPNTVGQYIGLKDKNGTKIFEGDVVWFDYRYLNPQKYKYSQTCVVKYDEDNASFFRFMLLSVDADGCPILEGVPICASAYKNHLRQTAFSEPNANENWEVIGNQYDPELWYYFCTMISRQPRNPLYQSRDVVRKWLDERAGQVNVEKVFPSPNVIWRIGKGA